MIPHFIIYTARPTTFAQAIESIVPHLSRTIVLDNRSFFDKVCSPQEATPHKITVRKVETALYVSQALNLAMTITKNMGAPFFTYMHDDCEDPGGALDEVVRLGMEATAAQRRWALVLTDCPDGPSDVMCAYNVEACLGIGGYDWITFPSYHTDNNLYARLKEAKYEIIHPCNIPVRHIGGHGTRTHNSSELRYRAHEKYDEASRALWQWQMKEYGWT